MTVEEKAFAYQRELGMNDSVSDEHIVARRMGFLDGYKQAERDLADAFQEKYAKELAWADTIDQACQWLFSHLPILVDYYNDDIHEKIDRSDFIKMFRKEMKEIL